MSFILDTCVISELVAKRPNEEVVGWLRAQDDARLYLTVVTVGEIQRGIAKLVPSRRQEQLDRWLHEELIVRFRDNVLPLTVDVMLTWGKLTASGRTLPAIDSLIAALALHHNFALVTRNAKDFDGTAVKIVNPWNL